MWTYLWNDLPSMPTATNKGVHIPIAKKKVLGMFPSSTSTRLIVLFDEQQKKFLMAQCERLINAARWHEEVERTPMHEELLDFFLLFFDMRTALLSLAYYFNLHHFSPNGFRWTLRLVLILSVYFSDFLASLWLDCVDWQIYSHMYL